MKHKHPRTRLNLPLSESPCLAVSTYQEGNVLMRALFLILALGLIAAQASAAYTQTPPAQPQGGDPAITAMGAIGEVKTIDAAAKQITIKTGAGSMVTVLLSDKTVYMRLAPGEQSLANAAKIASTDVGVGDRVWARGKVSDDHKSVPAAAIIVMTKADIAKKQDAERAEWRRRGILGVITTLKPDTKEITISNRTAAGMQAVIIPVVDKVELRRYAPDSINFSDAKPSTFEELKIGDQLRALGDRTPDGLHFTPEKVVTGSFRTVAGTVTAVNAAAGEIKITDLEKKQPLTIVIKQDAVLRKFPSAAEMGGMMGFGRSGGAGGAPATQAPAGQAPGATGPGRQGPGGGPRPGGGGFNIQDMLERLPTISLADLKTGDTIIVSSTRGVDPGRLTAIALVSGADTLLAMLAPRPQGGGQSAPNPAAGLGSGISFGIGLP
jgi:Cu/Ag efflux protein CusF